MWASDQSTRSRRPEGDVPSLYPLMSTLGGPPTSLVSAPHGYVSGLPTHVQPQQASKSPMSHSLEQDLTFWAVDEFVPIKEFTKTEQTLFIIHIPGPTY